LYLVTWDSLGCLPATGEVAGNWPREMTRYGTELMSSEDQQPSSTGAAQHHTGTGTVRGGKIVAADVTRTG
jgi:hypothetical protein